MNRLDEQINRIKSLMLINEQCGVDLNKCETDLEDKGYTVYNPNEKSSACENDSIINCVSKIFDNNGIRYTISSTKSSNKDCFVLGISNKKEGGIPKYHFTFYSDNQVIFTAKLNSYCDDDKLMYKGKFECDESSGKLSINQLKYQGVYLNGSVKLETEKKIKDASGASIDISSGKSTSLEIPSGDLKYPHYLTYVLDFNVTKNNVKINNIKTLLTT
jgi:hypothetical protein